MSRWRLLGLSLLAPLAWSLGVAPRAKIGRIRSAILKADSPDTDATIPPLDEILAALPAGEEERPAVIYYDSDFLPRREVSAGAYCARDRHRDCLDLFDGYQTILVRCEALDANSLNVRWEASWLPPGSKWLYDLSDALGWQVARKRPDSTRIATFSWKAVFGLFREAFATGNITLPISIVEGNTRISITEEPSEADVRRNVRCISLTESIDLATEADRGRLQNRRVAQEAASWIDVSRRPPREFGIGADEWAGIVRKRMLSGVPGAGALDVDPNEDDAEGGLALLVFGILCAGTFAATYQFFSTF